MRHVVVDDWSRGSSLLHRRDARAKLICLVLVLLAISVPASAPLQGIGGSALLVVIGVAVAGLPVSKFLLRTTIVLPFALVLALTTAFAGDNDRAVLLIFRSWVSAAAVLLTIGTTPLPQIATALRRFRVPALLVETIQFVYRYLFVLAEQVWRMRNATASRGGHASLRAGRGIVIALFAGSYQRAERIHRSMLARGYTGELPGSLKSDVTVTDGLLVVWTSTYLVLCLALPLVWIR